MFKRIISSLLCCIILLGIALPVCAEETEEQPEIAVVELKISTAEEFIAFAENCRLDSYSRNLVVTLEKDIDLSGVPFESVPIFSGSFDGKGHSVSGLSITADGSVQGLFRYLTATAVVRNLSVKGDIHPGGSRNQIGAIAGQSEGQIFNCSFTGQLSGGDYVGGIVGINTVTGIIENCKVTGEIHGDHFVGGIAGENSGVIRSCTNNALINTTPQQNSVSISDITMDTLTNTEAVNTVTDIGGIAGISSGVIRECRNDGDVGYQHMGYNIGGIAGTQSGYIVSCENRGNIHGRKEVGGIVGQMEPTSLIEYTEDTLQILQGQLNTMSGLVNQASSNAQTNANNISGQIGVLQDQTQTARDAVDTLLPDPDNPEIPDSDTILAAQNTLSTTLNAMPGTLSNIASATQTTLYSLNRDLNAISGQISAMGQTLNNASENLGGTVTDISDKDTPELLTGKVEGCTNFGNVLADLNAGGIAGAMAMENDLDILEDWEQNGEESLNFQSEIRAVILNCKNSGTVTGKKQNVGGIVGWQSLGLVKNCTNTGKVDAENADYAGGISGLSTGYIRCNYAKCEISGKTYVGGIAGSGTIVTDCISMVQIRNAAEKLGAILGEAAESRTQEEEITISRNIYPKLTRDMGAIDGISYSGLAEGMELDAFLALETLPDMFRKVTVQFLFEDGATKQVELRPGGSLSASRIPTIPEKNGFTAKWDCLDRTDLGNVVCDLTFDAVYIPYSITIQSEQTRENGLPIVLAEGAFTENATIAVEESEATPTLTEKETLLEAWNIQLPDGAETMRFQMPDGMDSNNLKLLLCDAQGVWQEMNYHADGTYLVFEIRQDISCIALVRMEQSNVALYGLTGVIGLLAIATFWFIRKKNRKASPDVKEEKEQTAC